MLGDTLSNIRDHIDTLAVSDGDYCVVCGRTGARPVPVCGKRFRDRKTARAAAETATAYRDALRQWDPQAPCYDFIACELPATVDGAPTTTTRPSPGPTDALSDASLTGFCHNVAAAVFQTLSAEGYDSVESTVMDVYCESATSVTDPDDLCLHLLGTLANELDERLSPTAQDAVLERAAEAFPAPASTDDPLTATFGRLERVGLLGDHSLTPHREAVLGRQSWTVTLTAYPLATTGDCLPTLPLVVDLRRRLPETVISLSSATPAGTDRWEFDLAVTETGTPSGLTRVPVVL